MIIVFTCVTITEELREEAKPPDTPTLPTENLSEVFMKLKVLENLPGKVKNV